jgi:hypothetical protein
MRRVIGMDIHRTFAEVVGVARQMGWPVRDSEMSGRSAVGDCLG